MSGTKIPISVDVSGVNKALDDFAAKVQHVNKTLASGKASINIDQAKKSLQDLEKLADNLTQSLADAGDGLDTSDIVNLGKTIDQAAKGAKDLSVAMSGVGVKGAGGFSKSIDSAKSLLRELERVRKLQELMKKEGMDLSFKRALDAERGFQQRVAAGARGTRRFRDNDGLASVVSNWRDLALNETDAMRSRREIMRNVGLIHGDHGHRSFGEYVRGQVGQAGRNVLYAATPAGVGGTVIGNAAQEAAGSPGGILSIGGMGRLAAGGLIGLAAFGAVKAIGSIKNKMNDAEQESIGYADLSRSMGLVTEDFERLRTAVRGSSNGLGITDAEAGRHAVAYTRASGIDGRSAGQLGAELRSAFGFARGMGIAEGGAVDLFATMRHHKVSRGDADNKRIALMLADAIAKAGVFTKADEVLQAVGQFTQVATKASFTTANVGAYTSSIAGLMQSGLPGMDPSASSSLINKIDSSVRGNKSEAFRNFLLGTLGRAMPGLTAMELGELTDGGAFGSAEQAWGLNSPAYMAATKSGDTARMARLRKLAAQGGNKPLIDFIMGGLGGISPDSTWFKENMKDPMGLTDSEANAFIATYKEYGGIGNMLGQYKGLDMNKVNPQAIKSMVLAHRGSDADRAGLAARLRGMNLSAADLQALNDAEAGKPGTDFKGTLMRLLSTRDMDKSEGDISRDNIASIEKATNRLATELIPATNVIRDGVLAFARFFKLDVQSAPGTGAAAAAPSNPMMAKPLPGSFASVAPMGSEAAAFMEKTRAAAEKAAAYINAHGGSVKPEWLQSQWAHETGYGKSLKGFNVGNVKAYKDWKGAKVMRDTIENDALGKPYPTREPFRVYDSLEEGAMGQAQFMVNNQKRYGKVMQSRTAEEFTRHLQASGYATDPKYGGGVLNVIRSVEATRAAQEANMAAPEEARRYGANNGNPQSIMFSHSITLQDRFNQPVADPLLVTNMMAPRIAGVGRVQ